MTLQLDGYDGPITVQLYIGPRIPSDETAVRDAVGFINFGDFRDQTEYGKVCLLYTSDAADERSSVDLGGRRIIKTKNNTYYQ